MSHHPLSPHAPLIDLALRRSALTTLGTSTQLSALVLLLFLSAYRRLIVSHVAAGGVGGTGSTTRTNANANNAGQGQEEKKKKGWLDRPAPLVGESWRAVLAVAGWGGWLALLGVWIGWGVGGDYLYATRAPAHIAASLLPFHLLLTSSLPHPLSPLPLLLLSGPKIKAAPNLNLTSYHRVHALLLFSLLASHAGLYLNFYVQKAVLWKKVWSVEVQLGLGMVGVLGVLAWFSMASVRRGRRGLFLGVHLVGTAVVLGALWAHTVWARGYVVEAGLVFVTGLVGRGWRLWGRDTRGKGGKGV